ncbi:hypothetical protein BJ742DRAFT_105170 [Cladochytrium replicatum]|nr:hypothetical protein BJ742DRAFT_105170 [Cladochytrium replicatum]
MVSLFSWLKRDENEDYEKVLAKLDDDVSRAEVRLSEVKIRERRAHTLWLTYTGAAYVLWLFFVYAYWTPTSSDPLDIWIIKVGSIALTPIVIVGTRRLITMWYVNKRKTEEAQLENLRAKQKLKIEELKKKTAYYVTKGLIERYETPSRPGLGDKSGTARSNSRIGLPGTELRQRPQANTPTLAINDTPIQSTRNGAPFTPGPNTPVPGRVMPPSSLSIQTADQGFAQSHLTSTTTTAATRNWYDRVMDAIIGDIADGDANKFALICAQCFTHNGLLPPEEYATAKYRCKHCGFLNDKSQDRGRSSSNSLRAYAAERSHSLGYEKMIPHRSSMPNLARSQSMAGTTMDRSATPSESSPNLAPSRPSMDGSGDERDYFISAPALNAEHEMSSRSGSPMIAYSEGNGEGGWEEGGSLDGAGWMAVPSPMEEGGSQSEKEGLERYGLLSDLEPFRVLLDEVPKEPESESKLPPNEQ